MKSGKNLYSLLSCVKNTHLAQINLQKSAFFEFFPILFGENISTSDPDFKFHSDENKKAPKAWSQIFGANDKKIIISYSPFCSACFELITRILLILQSRVCINFILRNGKNRLVKSPIYDFFTCRYRYRNSTHIIIELDRQTQPHHVKEPLPFRKQLLAFFIQNHFQVDRRFCRGLQIGSACTNLIQIICCQSSICGQRRFCSDQIHLRQPDHLDVYGRSG